MGLVGQEIKQRRPFHSPGHEGMVSLLRTADRIRRAGSRLVEPHGITDQQYNVLRILRGARTQGLPTLEIAERMIEQAPGITRLLDRLEAKGLVRRKRCPQDRRQVLCWISAPGLRVLVALDRPLAELDDVLLRALGRQRAAQLIELLDQVRTAYQRLDPGPETPPAAKSCRAGATGVPR